MLIFVLVFCVVLYVFLRSEFRIVVSVIISAYKQCSVRIYLQLFVGGIMSYLHYLCLLAYSGVQHILCCMFLRLVCPMSGCVPFKMAPTLFVIERN